MRGGTAGRTSEKRAKHCELREKSRNMTGEGEGKGGVEGEQRMGRIGCNGMSQQPTSLGS